MSVQALSAAFALRGVSPAEKLVLLALANYADERFQCWPSQERLAEDTELSARTVWGALKRLAEAGILSREQRKRQDGTRTTDVVTLHLSPLATAANATRNPCENHSQILHEPLAPIARPTTFEPSLNHAAADDCERDDWPAGDAMAHAKALAGICPIINLNRSPSLISSLGEIARWKSAGYSWSLDVVPVLTAYGIRKGASPPRGWGLFAPMIAEAQARRTRPPEVVTIHERANPRTAKFAARQDNLARAFAGSEAAARTGTLDG